MRTLYIDRYYMRDSHNCVFTGISLPVLERKNIKNGLKEISKETLEFDNLTPENLQAYYEYVHYFIKNIDMTSYSLRVVKYRRSQYCRQILQIIKNEYAVHNNEPLRVYIPFEGDKNFIRTLNAMVKKRKMDVEVEEIKFPDSKISQLAHIIAGCVYYHQREDLYEKHLGERGKPQLIAYLYSCKKTRNKLTIQDYIQRQNL